MFSFVSRQLACDEQFPKSFPVGWSSTWIWYCSYNKCTQGMPLLLICSAVLCLLTGSPFRRLTLTIVPCPWQAQPAGEVHLGSKANSEAHTETAQYRFSTPKCVCKYALSRTGRNWCIALVEPPLRDALTLRRAFALANILRVDHISEMKTSDLSAPNLCYSLDHVGPLEVLNAASAGHIHSAAQAGPLT